MPDRAVALARSRPRLPVPPLPRLAPDEPPMNACTVRCYGCDWTTTVVGLEAAQDAYSDHYKAKHWTPQSAVPPRKAGAGSRPRAAQTPTERPSGSTGRG